MKNYDKKFERNCFEIKKNLVLNNKSQIFKNWKEHSTITKEDFIEALEWLCDDPMNKQNRCTREIALTPTKIIKLDVVYRVVPEYYHNGEKWEGEIFGNEYHKISISCKERV